MPRAPIIPAGGFYKDADLQWSSQDVVNLLPTQAERPGSRTSHILRNAPGLKPYRRIRVDGAPVGRGRGLREVEGKLFAVVGTKLYQITDKGGFIERGTVPGVRRVSMAHNQYKGGNQLSIVNGYAGYIYDTNAQTFNKITDEGYPGGLVTFFVDQYLGYVAPSGDKWGHSDLNQGLDYNTLDTYEAEGLPDKIVTAIVTHNQVLVLGKQSGEYYVNSPSGDGTAPFARAGNMFLEIGCAAPFAATKVEGTVVLLDHNLAVKALSGYSDVRLSTAAIEQAFAECTPDQIAQAYTFAYEPEGYRIFYITVPGKFTFGYDFVNKEWHRRVSNGLDYWAVSDVVKWQGKWYAQDSRNGDLFELDFKYPREGCDELIWRWDTPPLHAEGKRLTVHALAPLLKVGGPTVPCAEWKAQPEGPTITGSAPDAAVGIPYSYSYTVTPGDAPIVRISIDESVLVDGLVWNAQTATISGTPTEAGTFSISPRVEDRNALYDQLADTIEVADNVIACGLDASYEGGKSFPATMAVSLGSQKGEVELNWDFGVPDKVEVWIDGICRASSGYAGLASQQSALNNALAALSVPRELVHNDDPSSVTFYKSSSSAFAEVRVYAPISGTQWIVSLSCPDTEAAAGVLTASGACPDPLVGYDTDYGYIANGGVEPYVFSVASGSLPPGRSLNPDTGVVSGEYTSAGAYSYTIRVTDSASASEDVADSVTVYEAYP